MSLAIGYYPGCSGQGTSAEYETSTRAVCRALDIDLREIPDWNCCGSTPAHSVDAVLSAALSARVFAQGEGAGIADVVTPCPSCLKNLRNALEHMREPLFKARVDVLTERPLTAGHSVRSVLQLIVGEIGLDAVRARVKRPLAGLKVVPYYGCLMNRPAESMRFDDPENPTAMDRLLQALGAEVLPFPLKVDCCGASFAIPARKTVPRLAGRILDMASSLGADAVVAACPLCQMNLDLRQGQINSKTGLHFQLPVPYFTQLMAYAFGLSDKDAAFNKLAVNIKPAFDCMARRAAKILRQEREAEEKAAAEAKKSAAKSEENSAGGEA
jgi:heterodisulfide reductase subunit B